MGAVFSSRVISASNMFMAMLRVEIVLDVIWSRLLTLASWPNLNSPPTLGHLNCAAKAGRLAHDKAAARLILARAEGAIEFFSQMLRRNHGADHKSS